MSLFIWTVPETGYLASSQSERGIPAGVEYHQVTRELALPTDQLFRAAWACEGPGKPVLEDLEGSKAITIAAMRDQTLADTKAIAEAEFFGDTVAVTAADVKTLYTSTEELVSGCTDVYSIKEIYCAFMGWDAPPTPRDEILAKKAQDAAKKLQAKLKKIRAQVAFRIALLTAVKSWVEWLAAGVEPEPAPMPEVTPEPTPEPAPESAD